jgi:broad specificity phosphatase PhoE
MIMKKESVRSQKNSKVSPKKKTSRTRVVIETAPVVDVVPIPVQQEPLHVYLVRHGQTEKNKRRLHQSPNTPLSTKGKEDAVNAAETLRSVNASLLLSSEYTRAIETARVIGLHTGLTPHTNGLFYEIVRPSKFYERSILSLETVCYVMLSIIHRKNSFWRYADAENISDITHRSKKALAYLESLHGEHQSIIVVSHTVFINILVSLMCTQKPFDIWKLFLTFLEIRHTKNGEIIHLVYTGSSAEGTCSWERVDIV